MAKIKQKRHYKDTPKQKSTFASIIWQTHEFIKPEFGPIWYFLLTLGTLGVLIFLIWIKQYALTASALLVVMLIIIEMVLEPRLVRVEVNEFAIKFGEKVFQYSQIKSYSILKMHDKKHLVLQTTLPMLSLIDIPLGKQAEDELKIFLDKYVPYMHLDKHPRDKFVFWR